MPDMPTNLVRKLEEMAAELAEINARLIDPETLCNHREVTRLSVRRAGLAPVVEDFIAWKETVAGIAECRSILASPKVEADLVQLAKEELPLLGSRQAALVESLQARLVTADERSIASVILEIRGGVGGDEAALWAGDLAEMYQRLASRRGWKVETLELSPGDAGGVKSVTFTVRGEGAFTALAFESGTHQVKRVPATEAQGRIHTSTATVAALPEPEEIDIAIAPEDVKEMVTTAQGPGGQNVNKVSTAVHLIHLATGIEVRMQETRSQGQNRAKAWQLLRARLYERQRAEAHAKRAEHRNSLIGSAMRAEKIRTYRYKENVVVDHRLEQSFNLTEALRGELDPLHGALLQREIAARVAVL